MRRALIGIGLCVLGALFAAPVVAADQPKTTVATPAMWTVHGPKGTAYLLGSIHILPKNVNWQTPQILDAVKRADTFVFEVKMDEETREVARADIGQKEVLPLSTSLISLFDEDMRNDFRKVIFKTHADPTVVVYLRPWLASMDLQGTEGSDPRFVAAEGVDNKIYAMATARKVKQFRAFETYQQQFRLLMGDGNLEHELANLRVTFKKILAENHEENINDILTAWAKGDVKKLIALGPDNPEMSPEDRKAMLDDRNRNWIPQIAAMLKEKHTYFITVGTFHLVGPGGVPNLLRAAGYQVDGP
jgi:hypothetical protein